MNEKLNRLELALLDTSNMQLDLYLEDESSANIRADIEQIKKRAALSTPAGELRERILAALG